jgi:hypothetical protein
VFMGLTYYNLQGNPADIQSLKVQRASGSGQLGIDILLGRDIPVLSRLFLFDSSGCDQCVCIGTDGLVRYIGSISSVPTL